MGIFLHIEISKAVTKKEWEKVYDETKELVAMFPLAERRRVKCHGIDTICLVPTEEQEETFGWNNEKTRVGWAAVGDYETMHTAEEYYLSSDLIEDDKVELDAGDAMLGVIPLYMNCECEDVRFNNSYSIWGNKTQGEPYHIYLLAIACLIEARLGEKAFVYGDITRGQCKKAVELANRYLKKPIDIPERCDMNRLQKRISKLLLGEKEKLVALERLYLGSKDAQFGECIKNNYSEGACAEYWTDRFKNSKIGTVGFDQDINDYLLWGFDLQKLCDFINFCDEDDIPKYEEFVRRILDAKLYIKEKNCNEILAIDQEEAEKITNESAGNNICEEQVESTCKQDTSDVFQEIIQMMQQDVIENQENYDISAYEDLINYKKGDSIQPILQEALEKSFVFYNSFLEEKHYKELMDSSPFSRCEWLIEQNRTMLLRDKDWDKIFKDIEEHIEAYARYYPMVRIRLNSEELVDMAKAIVLNDELYDYCISKINK